jgi:hypothetical protein
MAAAGKLNYRTAAGTWASVAVGGGSGGGSGTSFDTNVCVTLNANQSVASGANRKILFDTVSFDGNSEWDNTNNYWLCKTTGYYNICYSAAPINTYTNYFRCLLYVDGVLTVIGQNITGVTGTTTASLISVPNLYVVVGSYIEAYCSIDVTTSVQALAAATYFRVTRYK